MALLAVLWALTAVTVLSALALSGVQAALAGGAHRAAAIRERWRIDGCLTALRARLDRDLQDGGADVWRRPLDAEADACGIVAQLPDDAALDVNAATERQLREVAGFDEDLVRRLLERRLWGDRLGSFHDLLALASPFARDSLLARYAALQGLVAFEPAAWSITGGGVVVERWVRAGDRVAVTQRVLP